MKLLVVDDDVIVIETIIQMLQKGDVQFEKINRAYNGSVAIQKIQEERPDIIICDVEMPKMNGLEVLKWMRQNKISSEVIFLTAHDDYAYIRQAVQLSAADYLRKPFSEAELLSVIQKTIQSIHEQEIEKYKRDQEQNETLKAMINTLYMKLVPEQRNVNKDEQKEKLPGPAWTKEDLSLIHDLVIKKRKAELLEFTANLSDKIWTSYQDPKKCMVQLSKDITAVFSEIIDASQFSLIDRDQQFPRLEAMLEKTGETTVGTVKLVSYLYGETIKAVSTEKKFSQPVKDTMKYILEKCCDDITRDELAERVHLSPNYLSKLFSEETGVGMKDYILKCKIDKAKRMLMEKDESVSNIAIQVGFGNFSNFSTIFKKKTGMSPSQWRRESLKEPGSLLDTEEINE